MDMSRSGIGGLCRHPLLQVYSLEPPRVSRIPPRKVMGDILWSIRKIKLQDYTIYERCEVTLNSMANQMRSRDMGSPDSIVSYPTPVGLLADV
jgi:hypothetical protein